MDVMAKIAELKGDIALRRFHAMKNQEDRDLSARIEAASPSPYQLQYELPLSENFINEKANELLQEIIRIYALADNIGKIVENSDKGICEIHRDIVSPFMETATNLANRISPFYMDVAQNGWNIKPQKQELIEAEFRIFFDMLHDMIEGMENKLIPEDDTGMQSRAESLYPLSPLTKKFLNRPKRGTDENRLARIRYHLNNEQGSLFISSLEDLAFHIAQLLVEFENVGIANYGKGNPAKGLASVLARKAADKAARKPADNS